MKKIKHSDYVSNALKHKENAEVCRQNAVINYVTSIDLDYLLTLIQDAETVIAHTNNSQIVFSKFNVYDYVDADSKTQLEKDAFFCDYCLCHLRFETVDSTCDFSFRETATQHILHLKMSNTVIITITDNVNKLVLEVHNN